MMFHLFARNLLIVAIFGSSMAFGQGQQKTADRKPLAKADRAFAKGDFSVALKSYRWFEGDAKFGPLAGIRAGQCLLKLKNSSGAIREWKRVRNTWPDSQEAATALVLEMENTSDAPARKKLEELLLANYPNSREAYAFLAAREKLTSGAEADRLIAAGKREEAVKLILAAARRATGEERDRLLGQLASLYESAGDWRKAAGVWKTISEEGEVSHREAATFDWIRTTTAAGGNMEQVEKMWRTYLKDFPSSPRAHLAITRLAEMMARRNRADEAVLALNHWLSSSSEDRIGKAFVAQRLAVLRKQLEMAKRVSPTAFEKERLAAATNRPAEVSSLMIEARSGKGSGNVLNRIRAIRRELAKSHTDLLVLLQLDRAEAHAFAGQNDSRKALTLLDESWERNVKRSGTKDVARRKAASELAGDAIGIALDCKNHSSAILWTERYVTVALSGDSSTVSYLKGVAIRFIFAGAKVEGIEVLSILENRILTRFPMDSPVRRTEAASVSNMKALCANGSATMDNQWWVGEIPEDYNSLGMRALFEADLRFAAMDRKRASLAYSNALRIGGLGQNMEGYATLQLARCLAALGENDEALRNYRRFEDALARTKSAAPALLRAGTLCAGPMNDSRRAKTFFAMVSARYPESPEAEIGDWYSATLDLWSGDLRAARRAFGEFEKKHPDSILIQTLDKSIRPQLQTTKN